ncbi:hypothetical protein [uncultured Bifidobacterium sp.]|uniref:hypothetical protein n=1 Tax=uncultured Bifidobacterium sp. TaxID=165187 RepID=UPI002628AFE4|nr:hypothetical protein [uncultured Bifidobacterium sp.]
MKDSLLWKYVDAHVGRRIRARWSAGGETGAAMVVAIMFVLLAAMISLILLATIAGQAMPYVTSSRNSQAGYAADSGLQSALSFFHEAESSSTVSKLAGTDSTTSTSYRTHENSVVAEGTLGVGSDYTITITYYSALPGTSGSVVISPSSLTTTMPAYAKVEVTGKSVSNVTRTVTAIYKFGSTSTSGNLKAASRLGMGFYAVAPYSNLKSQPVWMNIYSGSPSMYDTADGSKTYDSANGKDATGVVYYMRSGGSADVSGYYSDLMSNTTIMNPANQTCMVATTVTTTVTKEINEMLDVTKTPQAGSPIMILPVAAYKAGTTNTYVYSEQCKSTGTYQNLNNWIYDTDGSIRLASEPTLCVTGADLTHTGGGTTVATLQECGNSYGPNESSSTVASNVSTYTSYHTYGSYGGEQSDYYTDTDKKAQKAEKADPDSLLNKFQKWGFYNGFVNAGYYNDITSSSVSAEAKTYDSSLPESQGYSVGGIQQTGGATKFQVLEASVEINPGTELKNGVSAGHFASNIYSVNYAAHYLMASRWNTSLSDVSAWFTPGSDMQDATASFGQAGEAGHATNQLVNSASGFCTTAQGTTNGSHVYGMTCKVGGGTFNPFCYSEHLKTGNAGTSTSTSYCESADNTEWKSDSVEYTEDTSSDGHGVSTQLRTSTSGTYTAKSGMMYYGFDSFGRLTLVSDDTKAATFTRYNAKTSDLTKAGTFQKDGKCLTEISPGDKVSGKSVYSGDGHSYITLETCGATTDYRGRKINSQVWNATVFTDSDTWGPGRTIISSSGSSGSYLITTEGD